MAFNPSEHLMQLKGKDYLQVQWRVVWFRDEHPDWSIMPAPVEMDDNHAIFKTQICDDAGVIKAVAHGSESQRDFGDYIEKAETKSVGRALALLGYGTAFVGEEFDEGDRIVDSPITIGSAQVAQEIGRQKIAAAEDQLSGPAPDVPMAAPGQIKFILDHCDLEEQAKYRKVYGPNLEHMTRAQAEVNVTAIQKRESRKAVK